MRHYCLGGCSAPSVCARRSRQVWGTRAGTWCSVSPVSPFPALGVPRCVWRAVLSGCPFPSLAGTPFHAVCAFRELGLVALLVVPRALCVFVRSRSRGVPSPPPWVVWRARLARSRHSGLVGPFHVVRAPPHVLPRSLALSDVLGGGRSSPGSPLPGLGLFATHVLWARFCGCGGPTLSPWPACPVGASCRGGGGGLTPGGGGLPLL